MIHSNRIRLYSSDDDFITGKSLEGRELLYCIKTMRVRSQNHLRIHLKTFLIRDMEFPKANQHALAKVTFM